MIMLFYFILFYVGVGNTDEGTSQDNKTNKDDLNSPL